MIERKRMSSFPRVVQAGRLFAVNEKRNGGAVSFTLFVENDYSEAGGSTCLLVTIPPQIKDGHVSSFSLTFGGKVVYVTKLNVRIDQCPSGGRGEISSEVGCSGKTAPSYARDDLNT